MGVAGIIGWVFLALVAIAGIVTYNRLVRLRNTIANAFAQIDVQLKRRYDLIPNLVETARKYMQHERETLEAVTAARNQALAAAGLARQAPASAAPVVALGAAEGVLGGALGRLMAVAESYPQLQAVGTFTQLQEELTDTEEKIAYARQFYNGNALDYNTRIQTFPGNQFARWFSFQPVDYFNAGEEAAQDVKVQFTTV
jgi:LemA protein